MNPDRLIMILEAELLNYQELKDFEETKTKLIINRDIEALTELLSREETLAKSLNELEEQRQIFLKQWQVYYALSETPTLIQVAEASLEASSVKIKDLRRDLLKLCKELGRQNRSNEILTKQSIEHVQKLFSILTGTNESLAYINGGGRAQLGQKILLDQSV